MRLTDHEQRELDTQFLLAAARLAGVKAGIEASAINVQEGCGADCMCINACELATSIRALDAAAIAKEIK